MISDSPSGKSNGMRLVAAIPAVTKRKNRGGCVTMPHLGSQPQRSCPCARAMSIMLSEPYTMITPMTDAPIAISAVIISAAARRAPRGPPPPRDSPPPPPLAAEQGEVVAGRPARHHHAVDAEREHREHVEDPD